MPIEIKVLGFAALLQFVQFLLLWVALFQHRHASFTAMNFALREG